MNTNPHILLLYSAQVENHLMKHYQIGEENFSGSKYSYHTPLRETFERLTGFRVVEGEGVLTTIALGEREVPVCLTTLDHFIDIESIYEFTEFMNYCIDVRNEIVEDHKNLMRVMEDIKEDDPRSQVINKFEKAMENLSLSQGKLQKEDICNEVATAMVAFDNLLAELHEDLLAEKRLSDIEQKTSQKPSKERSL